MNTIVACPACGQQLALTPAMLGKPARCPRCQGTFVAKVAGPPPVPKPVHPTPADSGLPVPNKANFHQIARSLEPAEPIRLKADPGAGNYTKEFTRSLMDQERDKADRRRGNGPPFPWWALVALLLLLLVPLVLYQYGVFDGASIKPASKVPPVQQAWQPAPVEKLPPVEKPPVEQGPPADVQPDPGPKKGPGPHPPPATQFAGLVGYWPFESVDGEVQLNDASGKGHDARILQGGVRGIEAVRGWAIQFNDKTCLDYGSSADFDFPAGRPFTLACWVKTREAAGTVFSQRHSQEMGAGIDLTVEGGHALAAVRRSGDPNIPAAVRSRTPINDDKWHHCAVVRQGRVVALFVDGVQAGTVTRPGLEGPIITDWRCLGMERKLVSQAMPNQLGPALFFNGAIAEFCVFNRNLSPKEIRQLAGK